MVANSPPRGDGGARWVWRRADGGVRVLCGSAVLVVGLGLLLARAAGAQHQHLASFLMPVDVAAYEA
jgi:hypothetical protein